MGPHALCSFARLRDRLFLAAKKRTAVRLGIRNGYAASRKEKEWE